MKLDAAVLCVATIVLWVRGYERTDSLVWLAHNGDRRLEEGQPFRVRRIAFCSARDSNMKAKFMDIDYHAVAKAMPAAIRAATMILDGR